MIIPPGIFILLMLGTFFAGALVGAGFIHYLNKRLDQAPKEPGNWVDEIVEAWKRDAATAKTMMNDAAARNKPLEAATHFGRREAFGICWMHLMMEARARGHDTKKHCNICEAILTDETDCGGDCVFCMAEAGDIDCIRSVIQEMDAALVEAKKGGADGTRTR